VAGGWRHRGRRTQCISQWAIALRNLCRCRDLHKMFTPTLFKKELVLKISSKKEHQMPVYRWNIHTKEYHTAVKGSELQPQVTAHLLRNNVE
jgi:hypothetical protein